MKPPKIITSQFDNIVLELKDSFDYLCEEIDTFKNEATGENRKFVNEDIDILRRQLSQLRRVINDLYIPRKFKIKER